MRGIRAFSADQDKEQLSDGEIAMRKSRFTNNEAVVAQLVEHILGRDEVTGPIPVNGSKLIDSCQSVTI